MGSFYVNITLRGPDQGQVVDALASRGRTASVSPTIHGFTVVYDQACDAQDTSIISELASHLSVTLACPALAVLNHDDDVLWYQLFENGQLADECNSCPDCFSDAEIAAGSRGGDASKLCNLLAGSDTGEIEGILRGDYLFEVERHEDLADALGLPSFSVGLGYDYLQRGIEPQEIDRLEFVWLKKGKREERESSVSTSQSSGHQEIHSIDGLFDDGAQASVRNLRARDTRIPSRDAVEIAKHHLGQEYDSQADYSTQEAWLLPRPGNDVWMVILIPSTAGTPAWAVYVDAATGTVRDSRQFLKCR